MDLWIQLAERLGSAAGLVGDALRNPMANRQATLLVLAGMALVLCIIVLTISIAVSSARARRAMRTAAAAAAVAPDRLEDNALHGAPVLEVVVDEASAREARRTKSRHDISVLAAWVSAATFVLVAIWVAAGVSTGTDEACLSCHSNSVHATQVGDPHRSVDCVRCHEPGGVVAASTLNVPERVEHYVTGGTRGTVPPYGVPSMSGCRTCHESVLSSVVTDPQRGLKVSHTEPLAAGAECLDCHKPNAGAVTAETVGMQPCLRCHDDVSAPSKCATCHLSDPANTAAKSKKRPASYAQRLVPAPDCGGCHSTASCDSCHRVKMPHTPEFKTTGHAREAAVELWKDGGQKCRQCHTETRRPCTRCHEMPFLAHGPQFKEGHKSASWSGGCTCHNRRAPIRGRTFCLACHETKPRNAVD